MLDGVLHQRLQEHAGNHHVERGGVEFLHHAELIRSKTDHLNVEIVVDEFHFFPQRHERVRAVQQTPENGGQFRNHFARLIRIEAHQRRNRVQSIEKKMRIDLVLQCLHARVQQQPLLLFQFDLDAHAVEDLEFDPDGRYRGRIDRRLNPQVAGSPC